LDPNTSIETAENLFNIALQSVARIGVSTNALKRVNPMVKPYWVHRAIKELLSQAMAERCAIVRLADYIVDDSIIGALFEINEVLKDLLKVEGAFETIWLENGVAEEDPVLGRLYFYEQ
jgi:hypothetical protein